MSGPPEVKDSRMYHLGAPPRFWSQWFRVLELTSSRLVIITAETISMAPSSFDAQVAYIDERGQGKNSNFGVPQTIRFMAGRRGFYTDAQAIKVRFRSHTLGQALRVRVDY